MDLRQEARLGRELLAPGVARQIRIGAGVTQARMAEELGVDRTTVVRWERGASLPRGAARRHYLDLLADLRQDAAS